MLQLGGLIVLFSMWEGNRCVTLGEQCLYFHDCLGVIMILQWCYRGGGVIVLGREITLSQWGRGNIVVTVEEV